jgi:hypothetical protein
MEPVILLTQEQAKSLEGRMFTIDSYFLIQQDTDDNNFITVFEMEHCTNPELQWIKKCPRIEYKPKPIPMPENETPVQE